jgi:hypothetical protein
MLVNLGATPRVVPCMDLVRDSDPSQVGPTDHPSWERIRWPDDQPLPEPGRELSVGNDVDGPTAVRLVRVITARPDFEPGWIGVEVAPV